ncbi:MAG: hydroxyacid dehydrogenase [Chloroflexi bacterium]|nr:hydroxyacid dehydrogenase [Chloroflexota bacterium]
MRILVLDNDTIPSDPLRVPDGSEVVRDNYLQPDELERRLADFDVLMLMKVRVTEAAIARSRLKFVQKIGVGVDNIDMRALTARKIPLANAAGQNAIAVAEQTLLLLLMMARRWPELVKDVQSGYWRPELAAQTGELHGKTIGIVGFGAIGREVAKRAAAFGMRLLAHTRTPRREHAQEYGVQFVTLPELLTESDYVSLHTPLTDETRHLIGADQLRQMKSTAVLLNAARGGVVDEDALIDALRERRIGGAALDVFRTEPLPLDSPLSGVDNVIVSPHCGSSYESTIRQWALASENLARIARGERPHCLLNPEIYE